MKVKYIYSACLEIQTADMTILTDPWFTQGIYDGAWYQFPETNAFEYISEPDYIYISHIHPDHYDPVFLHKLFDRFGAKPVLIPDFENNYLFFKGKSDGLILTPTRFLESGDTKIYIEENDTGSVSDIDSALIVRDGKNNTSLLNLNDCSFNQPHVEKLRKIIATFTDEINLLALTYTAAGPFPQTYFDINTERDTLVETANRKKQEFFERYLRYVESFPAVWHLPFAGEYLLGGRLAMLNQYRGVADAFEVTAFDSKALVLRAGGYIDLKDNKIVHARNSRYSKDEINRRLEEIKTKKLDYEKDFNLPYDKINFSRLIKKAAINALEKSELDENYIFIFSLVQNEQVEKRFLCDCQTAEIEELALESAIKHDAYSEIIIDYRCFFGLLTAVYHWNNADVGSLFYTKRRPVDGFNRKAQNFLNFFSIV